jgi:hypothetical protein
MTVKIRNLQRVRMLLAAGKTPVADMQAIRQEMDL